jgi:SRSO17 transposase
MIDQIIRFGFKIGLVLADSLYGESSQFLSMIEEKYLRYVVSIRKDHGVMMPAGQRVRANKWIRFERRFSDEKTEVRYVREVIYGKRHSKSYWEITTDPETMPENSTSYVMTNIKENVKKEIGNLYGLRTWIEYGFRQCKQELGWTDYRFTDSSSIEKWWEIILSVYTLVGLNSEEFIDQEETSVLEVHEQWDSGQGWKSSLNNLRLRIQPIVLMALAIPWLNIFPNPHLLKGLHELIKVVDPHSKTCFC